MNEIKSILSLHIVQKELVYLYRQSQSECTKNGKLSMEIGISREKDLIAVLYKYLKNKVEYKIDAHAANDTIICGEKFSIKHSSSSVGKGSLKWKWTSDGQKAEMFKQQMMYSFTDEYYSNIIIVYIDAKQKVITIIGIIKKNIIDGVKLFMKDAFVNRIGTNNRGVEFSSHMIKYMIQNSTFKIVLNNVSISTCYDPIQKRIKLLKALNNKNKKMKLD